MRWRVENFATATCAASTRASSSSRSSKRGTCRNSSGSQGMSVPSYSGLGFHYLLGRPYQTQLSNGIRAVAERTWLVARLSLAAKTGWPILAAVSSRQGGETTQADAPHRGMQIQHLQLQHLAGSPALFPAAKNWVPHPCRSLIAARVGDHKGRWSTSRD